MKSLGAKLESNQAGIDVLPRIFQKNGEDTRDTHNSSWRFVGGNLAVTSLQEML